MYALSTYLLTYIAGVTATLGRQADNATYWCIQAVRWKPRIEQRIKWCLHCVMARRTDQDSTVVGSLLLSFLLLLQTLFHICNAVDLCKYINLYMPVVPVRYVTYMLIASYCLDWFAIAKVSSCCALVSCNPGGWSICYCDVLLLPSNAAVSFTGLPKVLVKF